MSLYWKLLCHFTPQFPKYKLSPIWILSLDGYSVCLSLLSFCAALFLLMSVFVRGQLLQDIKKRRNTFNCDDIAFIYEISNLLYRNQPSLRLCIRQRSFVTCTHIQCMFVFIENSDVQCKQSKYTFYTYHYNYRLWLYKNKTKQRKI